MVRTLALCLGAVLALAPAALAATASGTLENCTGGTHCRYFGAPILKLTFEAAPGEINELRVLSTVRAITDPLGVRIQDGRAPIAAGDFCTSQNENEALCGPRPEQPISAFSMVWRTGDQADSAFVEIGSALLGAGDDMGRGNGVIRGGPGDDDIRFEAPAPPAPYFHFMTFYGGPGQDVLAGGLPTSGLHGGGGPDDLTGGDGPDVLRGGGGDDEITGGRSGDGIHGDRGNDLIFAGTEDDRVAVNDGQRDLVRCGPGQDRVRVDPLDVVRGCERVILDPPR
jgi:Ca2+-binding RTX toxin-like protein